MCNAASSSQLTWDSHRSIARRTPCMTISLMNDILKENLDVFQKPVAELWHSMYYVPKEIWLDLRCTSKYGFPTSGALMTEPTMPELLFEGVDT
mmetsp:Transcript_14369/g.39196  ORF Transcript_14369/g.39196 Transcript_14369/m.39196 type:complete len:94 (+) Transcript_14369:252-533(+)